MTRKLGDSHYANNQERTTLLPLKRLQNHIFLFVVLTVQGCTIFETTHITKNFNQSNFRSLTVAPRATTLPL